MRDYVGPALWIRIQHRFGPRKTEWMLAWIMFGMGVALFFYPQIFQQPQWVIFKSVMSPRNWGGIMAINGAICLIALFVNGARKHITPWFRVATALVRILTWSGILLAVAFSGIPGFWAVIYPTFILFEFHNIYSAARDTGEIYATQVSGHFKSTR